MEQKYFSSKTDMDIRESIAPVRGHLLPSAMNCLHRGFSRKRKTDRTFHTVRPVRFL